MNRSAQIGLLALCLTALFLSGCVTHTPMSDDLIFHDQATTGILLLCEDAIWVVDGFTLE